MRHFSVGLVTESGVEVSSQTQLWTRKAANQHVRRLHDSGRHKARRSGGAMSIEITEHLGSCCGCSTAAGLTPGCRVVDQQRIGG